jgi:hypothetical protein
VGELSDDSAPESPLPAAEPLTRKTPEPTTGGDEQAVANADKSMMAPTPRPIAAVGEPVQDTSPPAAGKPAAVLGDSQPDS